MPITTNLRRASVETEPRPGLAALQSGLDISLLLQQAIAADDASFDACYDEHDFEFFESADEGDARPSSHDSPSPLPSPQPAAAAYPLPASGGQAPPEKGNATARRNAFNSKQRRKRRQAQAADPHGSLKSKPRSSIRKVHASLPGSLISTSIQAESFSVTNNGAYLGNKRKGRPQLWSIEELKNQGFRFIDWDGCTPHAILDAKGRIIGALVGRPFEDPTWGNALDGARQMLDRIRSTGEAAGCLGPNDNDHRRGNFLAVPIGVSYGGGQEAPGNLLQHDAMKEVLNEAMAHEGLIRIAGHQSAAFFTYAPGVFRDIQSNMLTLFQGSPHLQRNFKNSIYPAMSINCGPATACLEHLDFGNAPHSLCAITSLGDFDPDRGGHLVLFPLKLAIRFPPGSTILIPSATVSHGNTPISPHESRYSITQYCAGGLLRWVAYGGSLSRKKLSKRQMAALRLKVDGPPGSRWAEKLKLYSTVASLPTDVRT